MDSERSSRTRAADADVRAPIALAGAFYVTGVLFVILGGLVAAITSPLDLYKGSWLAAYLVLVCGVSQAALGQAQAMLPVRAVPTPVWRAQFAAWNLGNVLVIVGTMSRSPFVVDAGGIVLLGVVLSAAWALRGGVRRRWGWVYAGLLVLLAVTIPIGLVLAHLRS